MGSVYRVFFRGSIGKWMKIELSISRLMDTYMISCDSNLILLMEEILHQLIGSLSHYLPGFIYARWCRISSINSTNFHVSCYVSSLFRTDS